MFILKILFTAVIFFQSQAFAQLFDGHTGERVAIGEVVQNLRPGSVLVLGEMHGHKPHHQNQRVLIERLATLNQPISVGMEFFSYPDQEYVDLYTSNQMLEPDFLEAIQWPKQNDFADYRFQVRFPAHFGGRTLALNMPRAITAKISKGGIGSLNPKEAELMPPQFTLGNASYFERFREVMQGHVSEEQLMNYFAAQSVWDDTMAWKAAEFLAAQPEQILVIIVGDFHVAYGGGLPDRLKARGISHVVTVSQGLELDESKSHIKYGARGDFIWIAP